MKSNPSALSHPGYWLSTLLKALTIRPAPNAPGNMLTIRVVGTTYQGRQAVVNQLQPNEPLCLRREPDNPFDRNAIRVERLNGQQVGYINRCLAAELAPCFDAYGQPIQACVVSLTFEQYKSNNLQVMIAFILPIAAHKGGESDDPTPFDL